MIHLGRYTERAPDWHSRFTSLSFRTRDFSPYLGILKFFSRDPKMPVRWALFTLVCLFTWDTDALLSPCSSHFACEKCFADPNCCWIFGRCENAKSPECPSWITRKCPQPIPSQTLKPSATPTVDLFLPNYFSISPSLDEVLKTSIVCSPGLKRCEMTCTYVRLGFRVSVSSEFFVFIVFCLVSVLVSVALGFSMFSFLLSPVHQPEYHSFFLVTPI